MRLPFLRSKDPAEDRARAATRRAAPAADDSAGVEAARTRARRRLAGALVLLVIGVVGFPILFETQPRPLPVDTPIRIAGGPVTAAPLGAATAPPRRGNGAAPPAGGLDAPAPPGATPTGAPAALPGRQGAGAVAESAVAAEAPPAPRAASAPAATPPAESKPAAAPPVPVAVALAPAASRATGGAASTPVSRPGAAPASTPAAPSAEEAARARALLDGQPAADRWVVQVGAYTDSALLHEARAKVEKTGLKTYTQVVENGAGKRTRVRLGPYATREEADAAAAKVKRAGLPAAIVKL